MSVDYSASAVARRLEQVDDLRDLCLALAGPRLKVSWRRTSTDVRERVREEKLSYGVSVKSEKEGKEQP